MIFVIVWKYKKNIAVVIILHHDLFSEILESTKKYGNIFQEMVTDYVSQKMCHFTLGTDEFSSVSVEFS